MTALYLLDTNTVSHLIKRHPQVTQRLLAVPIHKICISAITAGELAFGLAKRPQALALKAAVDEFLRRVEVLRPSWGSRRFNPSSFLLRSYLFVSVRSWHQRNLIPVIQ